MNRAGVSPSYLVSSQLPRNPLKALASLSISDVYIIDYVNKSINNNRV